MRINFSKLKTKGYTLVELLLYVSMYSIIMLSVTALLANLLQLRIKNQAINEVDQQGIQIMQTITQAVRNSESINSPAAGVNDTALSLDMPGTSEDPTVFDLSGNVARITEGAGSPISLSNNLVNVTSLTIENLTRTQTPGIVKITFTISYVNTEGRGEYNYTKTFTGSAALR